jgi:hypothetical protein
MTLAVDRGAVAIIDQIATAIADFGPSTVKINKTG